MCDDSGLIFNPPEQEREMRNVRFRDSKSVHESDENLQASRDTASTPHSHIAISSRHFRVFQADPLRDTLYNYSLS